MQKNICKAKEVLAQKDKFLSRNCQRLIFNG
jgi:hypothetical protein